MRTLIHEGITHGDVNYKIPEGQSSIYIMMNVITFAQSPQQWANHLSRIEPKRLVYHDLPLP